MGHYHQLSFGERERIAVLKQSESSLTEIALALRRSKSTISRELRRNQALSGKYWPDTAEKKALQRRQRESCLDKDVALRDFIVTHLTCHYWTPEQIAGWLTHRQNTLRSLSHETIYTWLYKKDQRKQKLWKFLPRHKHVRGLRKVRRGSATPIPQRISIHQRPQSIETKKEFGHFEGDLMACQKNTQHVLTLQERKTRFLLSRILQNKKAQDTAKVIVELLSPLPLEARKTITYDNGGEFAAHVSVYEKCGTKAFFSDPYASWQKGGIEHTNGRLRRDLPRNINLREMTKEDFDETIHNYNDTPRKCLNWFTPREAFNKNLSTVAFHS